MPYVLPQPVREHTAPYVFFKDLFSPEECQKIIDLHKQIPPAEAKIGGSSNDGENNPKKRVSELFWIQWSSELNWLFERLAEAVVSSNNKWWGYHLSGLNEALQLTHYKAENNGHYDWHEDHGDSGDFLHRKLSLVTLLNEEFEGGEFLLHHFGDLPEMKKGTTIVFPSFKLHKVSPVIKGERWSLVNWVNGPPFV